MSVWYIYCNFIQVIAKGYSEININIKKFTKMSRERNSGIVLGILAGAAIGSLLGVLFAPEKGVETRRKLRRKAEDLKDEALDHYEHLRDEALERYENISGKVKQGAEKVVADVKESYENYKKNS